MRITDIAFVKAGDSIPLNRRGDDFGFLLPLEFGKNLVVLVGDDGQGNLSSKLFEVERTDKFRAAITAPAFGKFANGQEQTVEGYVSAKYAEGTDEELGLAGASLDGTALTLVDLGGGLLGFSTTVPGTNCSVMALIIELCWTNSAGVLVFPGAAAALAACPHIPLGLLEGYEIVQKQSTEFSQEVNGLHGIPFAEGGCENNSWWRKHPGYEYNVSEVFVLPCVTNENLVVHEVLLATAGRVVDRPTLANSTWGGGRYSIGGPPLLRCNRDVG